MPTENEAAKARAEARFKKVEIQATEGAIAKAEHDARARAVDANTDRLRGLRLARDAADRASAAERPTRLRRPKA